MDDLLRTIGFLLFIYGLYLVAQHISDLEKRVTKLERKKNDQN